MKVLTVAVMAAAAAVFLAVPAQANPATPQPAIDAAAGQVCQMVAADPTENGMAAAVTAMRDRGFDDNDAAYTLLAAIHHVCPQQEDVLMGIITPVAQGEICKP